MLKFFVCIPSNGGIIVASVYHTSPSVPEEILLILATTDAYYASFSQFVVTVDCTLGHEPELISVAIYAEKLLGVSKWVYVYVAIVILRGQNRAQIFLALETCVQDHISVLPAVMHIH